MDLRGAVIRGGAGNTLIFFQGSDYILESLPWGKIQGSDRYLQKSRVAIRVAVAIATLIATLVS